MKELGNIKERYDFSVDARQLGLVLLGVFTFAAIVFVLGMSVGLQWEKRQKAEAMPPPVAATARASAAPVAPPVLKPVTTAPPPHAVVEEKPDAQPAEASKTGTPADLTFPKVLASNSKKTAPLTEKKKQARYSVQVAAFDSDEAARARADKLKKKGYSARVVREEGRKEKYGYKVRVGSFDTKDKAAAMAKKLKETEKAAAYVATEK